MTRLAQVTAVDVPGTFTARIPAIVATKAVITDPVMTERCGTPCTGAVAITALARRWNMRRRLLTEMAARTRADHLRVINPADAPVAVRLMTGLAQVGGGDVAWSLAARVASVVATDTIVRKTLMIERCRLPCSGAVTIAALACGRQMRCRLLSEMAARARTDHLRVINAIHAPIAAGLVTDLTRICTGDVHETLAARVTSVVTAQAVVADALMIEKRRAPRRNAMAGHAVCGSGDMGCGLAGGLNTVVATQTVVGNARVIKRKHDVPRNRVMAAVACLRRHDMAG